MVLNAIQNRRSRRAFKEDPLTEDQVEALKTALRFAPSCSNKQSGRYLFALRDEARQKVISALAPGNYWAAKAPLLVIAAVRETDACMLSHGRNYAPLDLGLGMENLLIQATALGLVGHPMAGFDPAVLARNLAIPEDFKPYAVIAVGYQSEDVSGLNEKHQESERGGRILKEEAEVITQDVWSFA